MNKGAKAIKSLGNNVFLTQAELDCYCLALRFKRRSLVCEIFNICVPLNYVLRLRLAWSKYPVSAFFQFLLIAFLMPVLLLWQFLLCAYRLILLPLKYLMTYKLPRDLAAPGEKNMAGVHNAFAHYFHFPTSVYVECFDGWVEILYGAELRKQHNLTELLHAEQMRCKNVDSKFQCLDTDTYTRSFVSHARERLTRRLGHYLRDS